MTGERDRGSVLITVAMTLLLLMGVAALVIDAGLAYDQRRSTQSAADHAALAAAWAACDEAPNPAEIGEEAAALNGQDDATVSPSGAAGPDTFGFEAEVRSSQETSFGRALGADDIEVVSKAAADCTVLERWAGGYAVAALGACPVDIAELDTRVKVVGKVQSNVSSPLAFPPMSEFAALEEDDHVFKFEVLDDEELEAHTNGDGELTDSGIYYADDAINNLDVDLADGVEATFVSPGPITFQAGSELRAFSDLASTFPTYGGADRLAVFSDYGAGCNDIAVRIQAAVELTGIIYAPHGGIEFSMEDGAIGTGALIGFGVHLRDAGYALHGNEYVLEFTE